MRRIARNSVALAGVCVALSGCSGRDLPDTVPVSGKVLFKGEPLADAEVGFIPRQEGDDIHPAQGRTDETGYFTLRSYFGPEDEIDGATPGEYIVTVQKRDVPGDPAEMAKMFQKKPGMVPKSLIPEKYGTSAKSNLEATVTKDGDNSFEFTLEE